MPPESVQADENPDLPEGRNHFGTWATGSRGGDCLTVGNVSAQIIGLGASTPVGRNAWASCAAVRAGICGFCEHPFMIDTAGEPMRIAMAPWLDVTVRGPERYLELLIPAVEEALAPLRERLKS